MPYIQKLKEIKIISIQKINLLFCEKSATKLSHVKLVFLKKFFFFFFLKRFFFVHFVFFFGHLSSVFVILSSLFNPMAIQILISKSLTDNASGLGGSGRWGLNGAGMVKFRWLRNGTNVGWREVNA